MENLGVFKKIMRKLVFVLCLFVSSCTQVEESSMYKENTDQITLNVLSAQYDLGSIDLVTNPTPLPNGTYLFYSVEVMDPWCIVEWELMTTDYCILNRNWEPTEVSGVDCLVDTINDLYNKEK